MSTLKSGWLSPTGEFFSCSSFDHIVTARELAEHLNLPDYDFKTNRRVSDDDKLMNSGWVYIGISTYGRHEWRIGWKTHLTYEQKRFLTPYFEDELPVDSMSVLRWNDEHG